MTSACSGGSLPSAETLEEHWHRHRFEYLSLAVDLPAALPAAIDRLRHGPVRPPAPEAPQSAIRRRLPVTAAFAAGAGLATLARKRRRA